MTDDEFVLNELRLSCADAVELVTDYLDGALGASDLRRFVEHTDRCQACTIFLDQVRRTIRLSVAVRDESVEVRPSNFDALLAELGRRSGESPV
ncbi:zf-HC2 domain-containing protein [Nocardia rhizosphaerae]|uniref:Zf-HC2 domain-containing protein n=1 Tax=Nocardia rhizosphaerae TaxID=1691571 RepID=A0ABV8L5V0_9NOCA